MLNTVWYINAQVQNLRIIGLLYRHLKNFYLTSRTRAEMAVHYNNVAVLLQIHAFWSQLCVENNHFSIAYSHGLHLAHSTMSNNQLKCAERMIKMKPTKWIGRDVIKTVKHVVADRPADFPASSLCSAYCRPGLCRRLGDRNCLQLDLLRTLLTGQNCITWPS